MVDVINELVNQEGPLGFLIFIFGSIFIVFLLWKSILWFTPKEREKRKLEAEKKARRYRRMGWKMDDVKHTGHHDSYGDSYDSGDSGDSGDSD